MPTDAIVRRDWLNPTAAGICTRGNGITSMAALQGNRGPETCYAAFLTAPASLGCAAGKLAVMKFSRARPGGNRWADIFLDDDDRCFFLHTLGQFCQMISQRIHAWVLMGNHYHLFIEIPAANFTAWMRGCRAPSPKGATRGLSCRQTLR